MPRVHLVGPDSRYCKRRKIKIKISTKLKKKKKRKKNMIVMSTPHHTIHHTTKSTYKKPPSLFLSPLFNTNTRYTTPPTRFSFFSFFLFLSLKRRRSENMGDDEWVKEAMTDDTVVVDLLLRLFQAQPPPPKPVQAVLRLGWTVRQRRSKSAPRHGDSTTKKKAEPARASPTTPLS